jgi:hypothetical protein
MKRTLKLVLMMMGPSVLGCGGGSSSIGRSTITEIGWSADGGMGGASEEEAAGLSDASLARDRGSDPLGSTPTQIDGGRSPLPDGESPDVNPIRGLEHRISGVR